ncbi:MAG: hypothetical protein WDN28_02905 [Chthoniobacter sp.]
MSPSINYAIEIAAIVVAGTMTGNEIAVAVFFHPQISRLENQMHARAAQALAGALGAAMPFWYALTLLLSLATTFLAHPAWSLPWWLALSATALFAMMIVYSVLLPRAHQQSNRPLAAGCAAGQLAGAAQTLGSMHAIRVGILVIALILLVASSVG